jgi:hypothetical protein
MARVARKLYIEDGIFAVPKPKLGKTLDAGVPVMIRKFYQNNSVSVSKNVHVQKRLILCYLKELYKALKTKLPIAKVSVASFSLNGVY